ncbi:MAG TPA: hypothetical protein VJI13_02690 [Candidatus Norongarragalinales archaeon]|nr:hypothetical protein [Candidatus Norongarragalinales archaeon]
MVSLIDRNKRGQTSTEYIFLAGGVIMAVVIIYALLQGNLVGKQTGVVEAGLADFLKVGEYFLFYDNFDSDSANQWTALQDTWAVENKEYAQKDLADFQKSTYAGSMGWVNYFADSKIQFDTIPQSVPAFLGGISGRVNKNTGGRYTCAFELTSITEPQEGKVVLKRFTDWQTSETLEGGLSLPIDTSVHLIAIQLNGNSVLCYFDGILQVNYTDLTPFKYGLISLEQRLSEAHFDMVRVKYQNGPTPIGPNPTAVPVPSPSSSPTPTGTSTPTPTSAPTIEPSPTGEPSEIPLTCSDGTPFSECALEQPYYCDRGSIVADCSECGCPIALPYCDFESLNCTSSPTLQFSDVINYSIGSRSAIINWTTNLDANGSVEYGTDLSYGGEFGHSDYMAAHSVPLSGLIPSTLYHYRIGSCNATLCNETGDFTFETLPEIYLSGIINYSITSTTAIINWTTNLPANGSIKYGVNMWSMTQSRTHSNLLTEHSLPLTGLSAGGNYTYQITSCASGACNTSGLYNFKTLAPWCSDTDGGIYPATYGTVTTDSLAISDLCDITGTQLTENYCIGAQAYSLQFACDSCGSNICIGSYCGDSGRTVYYGSPYAIRTDGACFCPDGNSGTFTDWYCSGYTARSRASACSCTPS